VGRPIDDSPSRVPAAGTRRIAGCAVLLLLALPIWDSLASLRWNVHVWRRLRNEHKVAPDDWRDAYNSKLVAYLPASGPIGLVHSGPGTPKGRARNHYLLQYSLAPRRLVESSDVRFVIVVGEGSERSSLRDDSHFELVRAFDEGLTVFRRID
jgi:hypothetical protein